MLDGTAELKTYELVEQNKSQSEHKNSNECVSKQEFDEVIGKLKKQIEVLKEGILYDAEHDTAND